MLVASWNVASFPTSLKALAQDYGTFLRYLRKHAIDVLCLQEVKVRPAQLSGADKAQLTAEGYESFWCPNRKGGSAGGFNGTATYARKGLTVSADAEPLRDAELDAEGRCLVTRHGAFTLVNIYAPASGGGRGRLHLKMRFFDALAEAVRREAKDAPVIIAGDYNVCLDASTVHWRHRIIDVRDVWGPPPGHHDNDNGNAGAIPESLDGLHRALREAGPTCYDLLRNHLCVQHVPGWKGGAGGRGGASGGAPKVPRDDSFVAKLPRRNTAATSTGSNNRAATSAKYVQVGKRYGCENDARMRLGLSGHTLEGDPPLDAWPAFGLSVEHLKDVHLAATGVALTDGHLRTLANLHGRTHSPPCCVRFMKDVLERDLGLVDALRHVHPVPDGGVLGGEGDPLAMRFTVWEQYTNGRYENIGARLDYVYVASELVDATVTRGGVPGLPWAPEERSPSSPNTKRTRRPLPAFPAYAGTTPANEIAALRAAVGLTLAGERYTPAPFDGGGMTDAPRAVLEGQFNTSAVFLNGNAMESDPRACAGTTIVYTPPKYSDHIMVTVKFDDASLAAFARARNLTLPAGFFNLDAEGEPAPSALKASDKATKYAQPHLVREGGNVKAMFQKAAERAVGKPRGDGCGAAAPSAPTAAPMSAPPRRTAPGRGGRSGGRGGRGIAAFFAPKQDQQQL